MGTGVAGVEVLDFLVLDCLGLDFVVGDVAAAVAFLFKAAALAAAPLETAGLFFFFGTAIVAAGSVVDVAFVVADVVAAASASASAASISPAASTSSSLESLKSMDVGPPRTHCLLVSGFAHHHLAGVIERPNFATHVLVLIIRITRSYLARL